MCETQCFESCNKLWNLVYAYSWIYVYWYLNHAWMCIYECLKSNGEYCLVINGEYCLVNMLCLEKTDGPIFQIGCSGFLNWIFQFSWPNRIFRFAKSECPVLTDKTYDSFEINWLWSSCRVHHILLIHTHIYCTSLMHRYRGSSLVGFSWKMCKITF
jgi:hypothetical protein